VNLSILVILFALKLDLKLSSWRYPFSSNPKKLWRWINSVKGYRRPLPPLQEDTLIVDDDAKATAFNKYFQSVF